jgi:hypothetical protein
MPQRSPTASPFAHAFRCEVIAQDLTGSREVMLAHYRAASPRLAARWMRAEAQRLARLLAPDPSAPHWQAAPLVTTNLPCLRPDNSLHAWANNGERYDYVLWALGSGNTYLLNVTDHDARYSVRAYALPASRPLRPHGPAGCRLHVPVAERRHRKPRRWRLSP